MLQVHSLGQRYGAKWIFRGIDFALKTGDSLIVLGSNGAGKSTLLKTIAGLIGPTEGKVGLEAADPRTALSLTNLDIALYAHLTPLEHLELSAKLRGCPSNADDLLDLVGLSNAKTKFVNQLSTGMRARLKLAIAVQSKPKLLMLDEPGAGLDDGGRQLLDHLCNEQLERGVLIVATNDPQERRFGKLELQLAS